MVETQVLLEMSYRLCHFSKVIISVHFESIELTIDDAHTFQY